MTSPINKPRLRATLIALAALFAAPAHAAVIGNGLFGNMPTIWGVVRAGEAEEVRRDFAKGFSKPLSLKIDPRSHPVEIMQIGHWLREQEVSLEFRESCVASCAKFILFSGKPMRIAPGTTIAFGGAAWHEMFATALAQVEAGELFDLNDERSRASRDRFLEKARDGSKGIRDLRAAFERLNPPHSDFINSLAGALKLKQLSFSDDQFTMNWSASDGRCLWWIPDTEGLRQLGIEAPDYRPVSRAAAAKLLKVSEWLIYIGPVPEASEIPRLCPVPEGAERSKALTPKSMLP